MRSRVVFAAALVGLLAGLTTPAVAQLPLTSLKASGQTVSPAYEGWYKNADGTYTLSFGYYNRNTTEVVDIPIGKNNFVTPGAQNQGQPTQFQPRRHWGVFGVKVPADFGNKEVVWTLTFRDATYAIPGTLHANWQIDALEGEASSGNTPPVLRFAETGPEGRGPLGVTAGPVAGVAGQPVTLTVWGKDDGKGAGSIATAGRGGTSAATTITWFKHQGPGRVTFDPATGRIAAAGGQVTTRAIFSAPGDYIVRVRANDSAVASAGHSQCCWSNGFLKVTVK
ncbi:MAG TPA: hypothetical protein VN700_20580 [Vicinamibacterales bacterium]|nr:hypothetical protein [Vicinamibacterales bacterium]